MKHVIRTWFEWIFALYSKIIITDYRLTFEHGNFKLPGEALASKLLKVISECEFASVTCLGVKILAMHIKILWELRIFLKTVLNSMTRFQSRFYILNYASRKLNLFCDDWCHVTGHLSLWPLRNNIERLFLTFWLFRKNGFWRNDAGEPNYLFLFLIRGNNRGKVRIVHVGIGWKYCAALISWKKCQFGWDWTLAL